MLPKKARERVSMSFRREALGVPGLCGGLDAAAVCRVTFGAEHLELEM